MTIKLQHVFTPGCKPWFLAVNSYDEMLDACVKYAEDEKANADEGEKEDAFNGAIGGAFEVFTEYFFARAIQTSSTMIGLKSVEHTSFNKFMKGVDFTGIGIKPNADPTNFRVGIQVKYRGNPNHMFSESELSTFLLYGYRNKLEKHNSILFTNVMFGKPHFSWEKEADEEIRILDRAAQSEYIDRDPDFWIEFHAALNACVKVEKMHAEPNMRTHQYNAYNECKLDLLKEEKTRARCSMVCGAGKTLVEYNLLMTALGQK